MSLRLPNPGADIPRLVHNYRLVFQESERLGIELFDLDFMVRVLTENLQASSRGKVGAAAVKASKTKDRSRDPLYNQMKSYSEVYRMLGWLRPGGRRLEFSTTLLGAQVAIDFAAQKSLAYGLIRECLMAVCFPNPLTENIGVLNHRPFSWLLKLCNALEGVISRHEIIIGLLAVTDDSASGAFTAAVGRIKNVRGKKRTQLIKAANRCARDAEVKLNSLENYTRLPVAILKSSEIGWGTSERLSDLYMEPLEVLKLSDLGVKDAEWVLRAVDIREAQLEKFPIDVRAHFANFAHYSMLVRAGLGISEIESELTSARLGCGELLAHFGISDPFDFIYSPLQQSSDEVISRAEELG